MCRCPRPRTPCSLGIDRVLRKCGAKHHLAAPASGGNPKSETRCFPPPTTVRSPIGAVSAGGRFCRCRQRGAPARRTPEQC
jgi:hypothetical protein